MSHWVAIILDGDGRLLVRSERGADESIFLRVPYARESDPKSIESKAVSLLGLPLLCEYFEDDERDYFGCYKYAIFKFSVSYDLDSTRFVWLGGGDLYRVIRNYSMDDSYPDWYVYHYAVKYLNIPLFRGVDDFSYNRASRQHKDMYSEVCKGLESLLGDGVYCRGKPTSLGLAKFILGGHEMMKMKLPRPVADDLKAFVTEGRRLTNTEENRLKELVAYSLALARYCMLRKHDDGFRYFIEISRVGARILKKLYQGVSPEMRKRAVLGGKAKAANAKKRSEIIREAVQEELKLQLSEVSAKMTPEQVLTRLLPKAHAQFVAAGITWKEDQLVCDLRDMLVKKMAPRRKR